MNKYFEEERVGEGTFGVVLRAKNVETGRTVAIKKIRLRRIEEGIPKSAVREVKALQQLSHKNVIKLYEVFPHGSDLVLVMEYMKTDLAQVLRYLKKPLYESQIKTCLKMILKGLAYCHHNAIIHRDIKPANLLFSPSGVLKLADFGLARVYTGPDSLYSHQVATRWYRAPELLFGSRKYDTNVDMWSVGCVFGELLNNSPLFPGENDIDQLYRVLNQVGTPDETTWPGVSELPDFNKIMFPNLKPRPFQELVPNASPLALDLLTRFLQADPKKRITAAEALLHPFFLSEPYPVKSWELPMPRHQKAKDMQSVLYEPFVMPDC